MINNLRVLSGYALKIERLKTLVQFGDKLTILFGSNGCGKSTTLKIAAAHCSINCNGGSSGGWSSIQDPKLTDNIHFSELSPGKCKADMEWNGRPTLFADSSATDQTNFGHFYYDKEDSPDGMGDMNDQLSTMFGHPSSGQLRMKKLKQYFDALKNPPNIAEMPKKWKNYNSTWTNHAKKQIDLFKSKSHVGPITFMMDEPDKSFSIENQMQFWTLLVPKLIEEYQVIIATHCPFALLSKNAHWIDFEPEYRNKSLLALKLLKSIM